MIQFEELKLELERTKPEIDDLADALGLKAKIRLRAITVLFRDMMIL